METGDQSQERFLGQDEGSHPDVTPSEGSLMVVGLDASAGGIRDLPGQAARQQAAPTPCLPHAPRQGDS